MAASASHIGAYNRVNIETASQGKLIVMLFNGAIKRAEEAKRQIDRGQRQEVHNNLIRAQEILTELRGALNMKAGEIAQNLDRIYEYLQHLLIQANIKKDVTPIDECVRLMTAMRDTWEEVFRSMAAEEEKNPAPAANPHGASLINVQG